MGGGFGNCNLSLYLFPERPAGSQKSQKAAVVTQGSYFTGETFYSALLCE